MWLVNYELTEIAGESFAAANRRNDLVSKATRFKEGLEIAKRLCSGLIRSTWDLSFRKRSAQGVFILSWVIQPSHICYLCLSVPPGVVFSWWVFPFPSANAGEISSLLVDLVFLSILLERMLGLSSNCHIPFSS